MQDDDLNYGLAGRPIPCKRNKVLLYSWVNAYYMVFKVGLLTNARDAAFILTGSTLTHGTLASTTANAANGAVASVTIRPSSHPRCALAQRSTTPRGRLTLDPGQPRAA
ncbi:hypothetical protein CEP52_016552 [Fusarium oligoseptatum]|uniref:Uncharacterized protein n=2 Tax=Fusarium solani species complex TaxID=232080 RepID=A0A428S2F9_9HYPO|nr:hypothetical protein CEP51_016492 [Fusarium floridanum]RSL84007.1 hypothetical protein CEP52_016552 [Fusarium oligoseptatum]